MTYKNDDQRRKSYGGSETVSEWKAALCNPSGTDVRALLGAVWM